MGNNGSTEAGNTVLFNVMVSRKQRGKDIEAKFFSIAVPENVSEHEYIRQHVRQKHTGWILGGYAPARVAQPTA